MAYTVPTITGIPYSVYFPNADDMGVYYTNGQSLPGITNRSQMYSSDTRPGSSFSTMGPKYGYIPSLGGWVCCGYTGSYNFDKPDTDILASLNGKAVLGLADFGLNASFTSNVLSDRGGFELWDTRGQRPLTSFNTTIPATIKYMPRLFANQTSLRGIIKIDANPTTYTDWLTGTTRPIKLTGKSTMLEELAAGYSNVSVYIPLTAKLLAQRINAETGDLDDEGTKPKITMTITGDPVDTTYSIKLYMDDLTTPLDTRTVTVPDSGEYEIIFTPNETLDMDTSHTFRAKITDSYGTVREVSDVLTQAFFTMDMGFEGHEIAFGGSAKELQDLKDAGREDEIPANGKFNCFMDVGFHGNVNVNGTPIPQTLPPRIELAVSTHTGTTGTIASGAMGEGSFTATKAGWTPIALCGFGTANGSGSGSSYAIVNIFRLTGRTTGSCTVSWRIRAYGGQIKTNTLNADILWMRTVTA